MRTVDWAQVRHEYETTRATLAELAEKYEISEGTVRSRASREKWRKPPELDRRLQRAAQRSARLAAQRESPQRAALHPQARPGNTNAVVTGEYQFPYPVTDEERQWLAGAAVDPVAVLDEQIRLCALRLRRMMALRMEAEEKLAELDKEIETRKGIEMDAAVDLVIERRRSALERIARVEDALSRVQAHMRMLVAEKRKAMQERQEGEEAKAALLELMRRLREEGDDALPAQGQATAEHPGE